MPLRKARVSRRSRRSQQPKPRARRASRKSRSTPRTRRSVPAPPVPLRRFSRADPAKMSMTELQNMAKSRGVPFGGLTKAGLAKKINKYDS